MSSTQLRGGGQSRCYSQGLTSLPRLSLWPGGEFCFQDDCLSAIPDVLWRKTRDSYKENGMAVMQKRKPQQGHSALGMALIFIFPFSFKIMSLRLSASFPGCSHRKRPV